MTEERVKGVEYAKLHKKNKELFAREQQLKSQEAKYRQLEDTLANVKDDPAALLELAGFSDIREFVERLAEDGGRLTPERRQLKELQKKFDDAERARTEEREAQTQAQAQETETRQYKAAVDKVNSDIVSFIKTNESKYSMLSLEGGSQMVFQELQAHYRKTAGEDGVGETLPLEKAVQAVNARVEGNLRKLVDNAQVRAIIEDALKAKSFQPGAASTQQPKTLTSAVRSGTASGQAGKLKDDEQLLAEATAFLKRTTNNK